MNKINPFSDCKRYGVPLKQCPPFIFFIIGIIIIISDLLTFFIGARFISDPLVVSLIVMIITAILFVLSYFINRSFEKLLELNQMKNEFISIVSHQLRTPLSSIRWIVDLMKSGRIDQDGGKYESYLDIVSSDVRSMERMINKFLMVAKIEDKKEKFLEKKVSLERIIQEVVDEFILFCKARNIEIEFKKEGEIPEISTDPQKVKVAIENLVDNAVKYSKEKGKVEIILRRKGKDIYLGVQDYGVGISPSEKKYIFQKFYRLEKAFKSQAVGLGLGLYLTKLIIEKLGGKIGFSSQENKGSLFWFTLPIK